MKPKLTLGQKLFSLNVGNAARNQSQFLTPVIVSKIGRKYFTVKSECKYQLETEYRLDNWRENHEYQPNSQLYQSEQEWNDEKESYEICKEIYQKFQYGRNINKIEINKLRQIKELIKL